jgi:hypothetical protein
MPPKRRKKSKKAVKKQVKAAEPIKEDTVASTSNHSDSAGESVPSTVPTTPLPSEPVKPDASWNPSTLAKRLQMSQYLKGKPIFDEENGSPQDYESDSSDGSITYSAKIRSITQEDAALHFEDAAGIGINPQTAPTAQKSSEDIIGEPNQIDRNPIEKPSFSSLNNTTPSQEQHSDDPRGKAEALKQTPSNARASSFQPSGTDVAYASDSSEEENDGDNDNEQEPSSVSNIRRHPPNVPLHRRVLSAPTAVRRSAAITAGRMAAPSSNAFQQSARSPVSGRWWTGPAPIIVSTVGSACTDQPQLRNYVCEFLLRDYMSRKDLVDIANIFWSCPHCRQLLDQPVLHHCGHMACLTCIRDWVWHGNSGPPCCVECATCLIPGCQTQFDGDDQAGADAHKQEWQDQVQVSRVLEETMGLIWHIYGSR